MKTLLVKIITTLIFLLSIINYGHGQSIDALLLKAEKQLYSNTDSTQIYSNYLLEDLKLQHKNIKYAKALTISALNTAILGNSREALNTLYLAKSNTNNKPSEFTASLNIHIGEIFYNWSMYDSAIMYFQKAYFIANSKNSNLLRAQSLLHIGKYYHSVGAYNEALNHYNEALKLSVQQKDTLLQIIVQNKIGKHFETIGSYTPALTNYLHSEKLIHSTKNKLEIASTYNHLGNIYNLLGDFELASKFHNKALSLRQQLKYKEGIAKSLNNIGEVLHDKMLLDSALTYFSQSYSICLEMNYPKGMIKSLNNMGIINSEIEKKNKAIENFRQALNLSNKINYDKGKLNALLNLAKLKLTINNKLATSYIQEGLTIAEEKNIISMQSAFYELLSSDYQIKNEHEKALHFYKLYHIVQKKLTNAATNKKIIALETQFEISLKENENEMLKRENKISALRIARKNTLIYSISIILLLLIVIIASILYRSNQKNRDNNKLIELNEQISKQNATLDTLNKELNQSVNHQVKLFSIISHELRNPLWWFRNLIQMLTDKIDTLDKAMIVKSLNSMNESATNTFHLMDNLLQWSRSQLGNIKYNPIPLSINELITENLRMVKHATEYKQLKIKFDRCDTIFVFADKHMVQTIYRNLLSNAIKFTPENGSIITSIDQSEHNITINVTDTGIGITEKELNRILDKSDNKINTSSDLELGTGLGLLICKDFISQNKGHFHAQSQEKKGTVFSFTLPIFTKAEH